MISILENGQYGHASIRSEYSCIHISRYRYEYSLRWCPSHLYH